MINEPLGFLSDCERFINMQIIYLVVGVIAYEGDVTLFAYKSKQDAETKLSQLERIAESVLYSRYEIQTIGLM